MRVGVLILALVVFAGCQSRSTSGLVPCGDAHAIVYEPVREDSAHILAEILTFGGGLQLGMDSTARKLMDPVAGHCGLKDWDGYAVHGKLGQDVDYLFYFKKSPYQTFSLNSYDESPDSGIFVQVKHGTSELSCVDCVLRLPRRSE